MVRPLQRTQHACADRLADGTIIRLRPIRPEDETLLEEFAAHMSPEDMRLRFFAAIRGLSRELAARLSHIDHDSEAALLAFAEDAPDLLAVARFSADAGDHTAEFAIAVRSDWKRHGLGHLLMTRLIELARQRGIDELVGEVLPENTMMLQLCRKFGFTIEIDPNDRQLLRVGKLLQRRLKPHRESPNSSRPLNSSGAASVLFTVIYRS